MPKDECISCMTRIKNRFHVGHFYSLPLERFVTSQRTAAQNISLLSLTYLCASLSLHINEEGHRDQNILSPVPFFLASFLQPLCSSIKLAPITRASHPLRILRSHPFLFRVPYPSCPLLSRASSPLSTPTFHPNEVQKKRLKKAHKSHRLKRPELIPVSLT